MLLDAFAFYRLRVMPCFDLAWLTVFIKSLTESWMNVAYKPLHHANQKQAR
jgi:hypothetical protein